LAVVNVTGHCLATAFNDGVQSIGLLVQTVMHNFSVHMAKVTGNFIL